MIKKYISERIAHRWGKYYQLKRPVIKAYKVLPHPTEFGFAIYVKVNTSPKYYPIGA